MTRRADKHELMEVCKKFIKDNNIGCKETIHQTDWVIENAYELIEKICSIVGYYDSELDGKEKKNDKKNDSR
jgi:hypothetical protein